MFKRLTLAIALATAATIAVAAPVSYKIDPNHTDVVASWSHLGFSNPVAHFGQVDGTIVYDAENVGASKVEVTIPLAGLNSHVEAFDKHLRSGDLFDAEKFPTVTFRSTKVEAAGANRLRVTGDLTIRGITKPVVLATTLNKIGEHPMAKRQAIGFDATTTIKRSDFGISYAVPAVSDEIRIRITTEAMVPKAEGAAAAPARVRTSLPPKKTN
ncbi:YceI family protein [Lysobacter humi (ex Lee et al. 2017)]